MKWHKPIENLWKTRRSTFWFAGETNFSFSPANQIVDRKPLKICRYGERITVFFKYFHGQLSNMFEFFIFFWKRLGQALNVPIWVANSVENSYLPMPLECLWTVYNACCRIKDAHHDWFNVQLLLQLQLSSSVFTIAFMCWNRLKWLQCHSSRSQQMWRISVTWDYCRNHSITIM